MGVISDYAGDAAAPDSSGTDQAKACPTCGQPMKSASTIGKEAGFPTTDTDKPTGKAAIDPTPRRIRPQGTPPPVTPSPGIVVRG